MIDQVRVLAGGRGGDLDGPRGRGLAGRGCGRGRGAVGSRQQAAGVGGDPLHDAGQTVQTGDHRAALTLQTAWNKTAQTSSFRF